MSSTPDRDVERDIDNGDAPLDATSGEQVCPGNSSSVRTGSEAVESGNQRGLREQATSPSVPSSLPTFKAFDHRAEVDTTGKYLVLASSAIMAYLESHFRRALTDDERKTMLTLQPRPATDAMFVPTLDELVKSGIGQKYPKLAYGRLSLIQQALHAFAEPLTYTWASLLDADSGEAVPIEDVQNIIQRTIVLMGNVNALTTQARQQTLLEAGGKEVAALMKDEMPQAGRHLFCDQFAATLTEKVKASTELRDAVRLTKPATTVSTGTRPPFQARGFGSQRDRTPFASQFNPADIEMTVSSGQAVSMPEVHETMLADSCRTQSFSSSRVSFHRESPTSLPNRPGLSEGSASRPALLESLNLRRLPGSNPSGQLCIALEKWKNYQRSMGPSHSKWLSAAIEQSAISGACTTAIPLIPSRAGRFRGTTVKDDVSQSYRESTPRVREAICEPTFCNPDVGRSMASRLQFEKPEQLYPDRAPQDGVSKSRVRPPLQRLVYVQTRSKRCVSFDSHSSGRSEVAPFSVARSNVSIQVPAIRTIKCATNIHQKILAPVAGFLRSLGIHLVVYLDDWLFLAATAEAATKSVDAAMFLLEHGLHHFRRQVNIEASSVPGVLRNSSRFCIHALSSSRPEVHWNQQGLSPYVKQGHCLSLNVAALARQDAGCGQRCSIGAGKVKDATVVAEHAPRRTSESGPVEHCPSRPVMVDSPDSFSAVQTHSDLTAVPDSDNRCI